VTVAPLKDTGVPPGANAATFTMEGGRSFELSWAAATGDVRATLAIASPKDAGGEKDRFLAPPAAGGTLGDDPAVRGLLDALGPVAGALVAQPSKGGCAGAPGGFVAAWSKVKGADQAAAPEVMWGEALASDAALRCLVKAF
jgi:hypothetical protein